MTKCTWCGEKVPAGTASVTVNASPGAAHEGPVGTYHLGGGQDCFARAVQAHKAISSQRLIHDAEILLGTE